MFSNIELRKRDQESDAVDALSVRASEGRSAPKCSICGRQDETLRAVSYPYVFSVILLTFRRGFSGLFCSKHRNQRLLAASAITAVFGWLGVPFGLLWTPVTLFKLAQGGEQPQDLNRRLLKSLAEQKEEDGDQMGALRCLEASLRFGEDEETVERVHQLRAGLGLPFPRRTFRRTASCLSIALLSACLVTATAFILDSLVTVTVATLLSSLGSSVYVAAFSWLPGVAIAFVGGVILAQVVEGTVVRLQIRGALLSGAIGLAMAIPAAYGIVEGVSVGQDVSGMLLYGAYHPSPSEALPYAIGLLTRGAPSAAVGIAELAMTSDFLYPAFIAISFAYYLTMMVGAAVRAAKWQQRLPTVVVSEQLGGSGDEADSRAGRTGCLAGCGASALLLCLALACAVGAIQEWDTVASRIPLSVGVDCPEQVQEGETFEAVVRIQNRESEPGSDLSIDLDSSLELNFIDGIKVIHTDPPYASVQEGSPGHHFYHFDLAVMPGETREVTFELKGERPGDFHGLVFVDVTTDAGRLHTRGTPIEVMVLP